MLDAATLARGIAAGYWTLQDLDSPSPAFASLETDRVRSAHPIQPGYNSPTMKYPLAGTRLQSRNLAREWIDAHPEQWAAMNQPVAVSNP